MISRETTWIIVGCLTVILLGGMIAYVSIHTNEQKVKVAQQIEVEKAKIESEALLQKTKIEQEAELSMANVKEKEATKRTQERFSIFFWNKK